MRNRNLVGILFSLLLLVGCRGVSSTNSPIHPNPNMDSQQRFEAQEANPIFADGRAMRIPVAGTIARGRLFENPTDMAFQAGKNENGSFIATNPLPLTEDMLKVGQNKFVIYCAPCHGDAGDGAGIVWQYGKKAGMATQPANLHQDFIRAYPDGQIFDVITNGIRTMGSYKNQIQVEDRWKIVAYVRALQLSQDAPLESIPENIRQQVAQQPMADSTQTN